MAEWIEVLSVVRKGASELRAGEMVHSRYFQLADAISAVEIGDPRMDFPIDENLQAECLIANGRLPLGQTIELQLAVVDGLIRRLAQWWSGVTLLQTLYTSLHMLARDKLQEEPFLGPVCDVMTGIISVCKSLILSSIVVEEEDCPIFSPNIPEEPAPSKDEVERISALLAGALAQCSGKSGGDQTPELAAMHERIAFLKHLFLGLCEMYLRVSAAGCRRARSHFASASEALASVRASAAVVSRDELTSFVPRLHLSAWALPPPPVEAMPLEQALDLLSDALSALTAACGVIDVTSLPALKAFLASFLDGYVVSIARAALHTQLVVRETSEDAEPPPWGPSVRMLMRDVHLSSALASQSEDVRMFLEQAQLATSNFVQALCMNKSRVRRRLRTRLEDYSNLYTHALNADSCPEMPGFLASSGWTWPGDLGPNFAAGPCSLWVEHEVSACMLQHLLMGFELSLYSESEYLMVYWYCDYLISVLATTARHTARLRPKQTKQAAKKKGRAPQNDHVLTSDEVDRVAKEQMTVMALEAMRNLCQGTLRLTVAVQRAGLRSVAEPAFGNAKHRFEQRFDCFQCVVAPPALSHDYFLRTTDASELTVSQLLELPLDSFKSATTLGQQVLENAKQHQGLLTDWEMQEIQNRCSVAKRNWFACSILTKAFAEGRGSALNVQWEFSQHKHFPTITVKTS